MLRLLAGKTPQGLVTIKLAGSSIVTSEARGEILTWKATQTDMVLAVNAATWQTTGVPQASLPAAGEDGNSTLDTVLPISVLRTVNEQNGWEAVIPVFAINATPGQNVQISAMFASTGPGYQLCDRIAVGWNNEIIGSFFFSESEAGNQKSFQRQIAIPAEKVRAKNCLWLATGYGQIGLGQMQIDGGPSRVGMEKGTGILKAFEAVANKFRYPDYRANGKVLLLSKEDNRQICSAYHLLVLDPMALDVDEYALEECPPSAWGPYRMVVIATWFLPPLSEEERGQIIKYVEQGGKLYIHSTAYWRMFGTDPRNNFDESLLDATLVHQRRSAFEENDGYLTLTIGGSELSSHISKSPWSFNRILEAPGLEGRNAEITTFSSAPDTNTVFQLVGENDTALSLFRHLGKGWLYVDGFNYLEPETVGLTRYLIKSAFEPESPIEAAQ